MRTLIPCLSISCLFGPTTALAHAGHLGGAAAHDPVILGAGIAIAVGVAAWAALKEKQRRDEAGAEGDAGDDGEEAPA